MKRRALLFGMPPLLVLLAGCQLPQSGGMEAELRPLPSRYVSPSSAEEFPNWESSFSSSELAEDVESLRQENLELAAARARVEAAVAAYGIQRSESRPSLTGSAEFAREREKDAGGRRSRNRIELAAVLDWELDVWGRLRAKQAAAELVVEQEQALLEEVARNVQRLLVQSWVERQAASELLDLLEAQLATNTKILGLLELRFQEGQASALDVLQQQRERAAVGRELPGLRSTRDQAGHAYDVLLGRFPDGISTRREALPDNLPQLELPSPEQLWLSRPDVRAGLAGLRAADQEVAAAVAERLPSVRIGLSATVAGTSVNRIGDESLFRFASGLLAPLFDAGRLKASTVRRRAEAMEALADLEQALRVAVREVEDAWRVEQALAEEWTLLQQESKWARGAVEQARLAYQNGAESYLVVLDNLRSFQELEREEILLKKERWINRADLLDALGAPWRTEP